MRLIKEKTSIDFLSAPRRKLALILSVIMVVVSIASIATRGLEFGIDFTEHFALELARLETLAEDGLIRLSEEGLETTARGMLLVRAVALVFDEYLSTESSNPSFSKVI